MTGPTDIEALIDEFQRAGLRELHVRADGIEVYLSSEADAAGIDGVAAAPVTLTRPPPAAPAVSPAPVPPSSPAAAPAPVANDLPDGAVIVRAPYLGTFYRAPKPGSPVYVSVGDAVTAEAELCLVEVMKLFTAVRAGTAGIVHAVLAEDGQMVQADAPLFAILPA